MTFVDEFLECGAIIQCADQELLIGYGKRTFTNHSSKNVVQFYAPDYFLAELHPWFFHEHYLKIPSADLINYLKNKSTFENHKGFNFTTSHKKIFEDSFHYLQKQFDRNKLSKAVPYIFESSQIKMSKPLLINALINILENTQNFPFYIYGFWDELEGMLGATPELLFSIDKSHPKILRTMACAGTQNNQDKQSLLENPKLTTEHAIVIEDIVNQLKSFGALQIGKTTIKKLPKLSHLVTPVEVQLNREREFKDYIQALHPTSALGAYPRNEGWDWLLKYQSAINRRRFGAPFGYFDPFSKEAKSLVAIRNVQWDQKGMQIGAGCGVTKDSSLHQEWDEIGLKISAIKALLKFEG